MSKQYRLPHPSEIDAEAYIPPPPRDDDGDEVRRSLAVQSRGRLTALSIREALAAMYDDESAWREEWRRRFPDSAAVHDGVRQSEAGVVPDE